MTPSEAEDLLHQAAGRLRDRTPPAWIDISSTVHSAVRAATRHSWPVLADTTDLHPRDQQGRVYLSDQVIKASLRALLDHLEHCQPRRIDLTLDGQVCTGVDIEIAAAYGHHLPSLAEAVRTHVTIHLSHLLGATAPSAIHVRVSDLTEHPIRHAGRTRRLHAP